ncbi:permease-like cell division protein FtsX [soil metagenome]
MAISGNYVVRETTANLTRNVTLTVASVLTVFVSLAIVGTTVLVRQGAQNMTQEFEGGVEFVVYLDPQITEPQRAEVETALEDNPGIERIEYVDQEATFEDFQRIFEGQDIILDVTRPEDLPTRYRVVPVDTSVESIQELVALYRQTPNVFEVRAATEVIREMQGLTTFVNNGLSVFAVVLIGASSLLILNTIRTAMFARRREIEVMKLVGATNWFIRVPFMLEGLIQGLVGGGMAVGFVFLARRWIDDLLNRSDGLSLLQTFSISTGDVRLACIVVVLTAVALSVVSSTLATRRFLDV